MVSAARAATTSAAHHRADPLVEAAKFQRDWAAGKISLEPERPAQAAGSSSFQPLRPPAQAAQVAAEKDVTNLTIDGSAANSTATLTLRDLLPDASARTWRQAGSIIADRPLDLSDVLQRTQLMAAQMAAPKCLGEVLLERGATPFRRACGRP